MVDLQSVLSSVLKVERLPDDVAQNLTVKTQFLFMYCLASLFVFNSDRNCNMHSQCRKTAGRDASATTPL